MVEKFDVLVLVTPADFQRVQNNYPRLIRFIPLHRLIFIGNTEVGELVHKQGWDPRITFLNEEELLPFQEVHKIVMELLERTDVPRGVTGWYYQQFLKMQYCYHCKDRYYMTWDGDTIPCKTFEMFHAGTGIPYFDLKQECHGEYFVTMEELLGLKKCIAKSFISEHMLFRCDIMQQMIGDIMRNEKIEGSTFYEKILRCIGKERLMNSSFSEFETYGTYTAMHYTGDYKLRRWHSFRYCGNFFDPDTITDEDYEWLGHDFDAVSFEKGCSVREDHKDIFTKKEYRDKLTARQILEIAQEAFTEGYKEVWD